MDTSQTLRGFTTISYWAADLEVAKKWYAELLGIMYNPHYLAVLDSTRGE